MRTLPRLGRSSWSLLAALAALLLIWVFFGHSLNRGLSAWLLISSPSPREDFFRETVQKSPNQASLLRRCWNTGKIVHRQLVATWLSDHAASPPVWFARMEDVLEAGTLDADLSVRELALATMAAQRNPRLFQCARAQLADVDPSIRILGLEYLRKTDPHEAVPVIIPLLDDPELRVAVEAEMALMRLSGQDFGVRMRLTIPGLDGATAGHVIPANLDLIQHGMRLRKEWWQLHEQEYARSRSVQPEVIADRARLLQPNFTLKDLQGRKVHLSEFRGRTVLLNFWATWCTACQAELPDLVALQEQRHGQVAILGIALDGVPDEHGHTGGQEGNENSSQQTPTANTLRAKLERTVKRRGINYPILWDPAGKVGGQFNGGELPTTVLLDSEGRVRRRFVGERSLKVFEAMIDEVRSDSLKIHSARP